VRIINDYYINIINDKVVIFVTENNDTSKVITDDEFL